MIYAAPQPRTQTVAALAVNDPTAALDGDSETGSGTAQQDAWLVSFIDILILLLALFVLLLILIGYAWNSGHFQEGLDFLFKPDFSKITGAGVLEAMGHAFFTLSLGMGAIMAYGAYLPEETSITGAAATVVIADTAIALLAGLVIFPMVFANGLDLGDGPGLVFQTLPLALGQMPGGAFFSTIFFVLLSFAAWTSAISLIGSGAGRAAAGDLHEWRQQDGNLAAGSRVRKSGHHGWLELGSGGNHREPG